MTDQEKTPAPSEEQASKKKTDTLKNTTAAREGGMVDLAEAQRFLDLLEPGGDFTFQTFDDSEAKRPELIGVYHGTLDEHATRLAGLNKAGAGIYVTVNATDGEGRRAANVAAVRGCFADFDDLDPTHSCHWEPLPESFRPTITVESSHGKHHAYWLTDEPGELALAEFKPFQQGLARWLGSDSKVNDLPRVMRLPGFLHNKAKPFRTRIIHKGERLSGEVVRTVLAPHLVAQEGQEERKPVAEVPPTPLGVDAHPYARAAAKDAISAVQEAPDGDRNNTLNREAHGVFGLVKGGYLDERESRQALVAAAHDAGLSASEIRATLRSAWEAAKPRGIGDNDPMADFAGEGVQYLAQRLERVNEAIARVGDDPGAVFERGILDDLRGIRQESPANWQRLRAEAKAAKVALGGPGGLDALTVPSGAGAQGDEGSELFPPVEPWPEPVDGATLVRELSDTLGQYVKCTPEVADAAALWITFSWFIDEVHVAPVANITAPLPNCGKSTLLEFIETFAFRPLKCDGISPAALFRSMDKWRPTLLVDEVDTFLKDNEEARGVLNSGHARNGYILRVVGDDHEPKRFSTWGAKALCGIGSLASTLASRSLRLELRRKLPGEMVENIRFMAPELRNRLLGQLARLHEDLADTVRAVRPQPVPGLSNRAADNWEPLQQIAQAIGGEWPEQVKVVAMTITDMDDEVQATDIGVELLKGIRAVFDERGCDRIHTAELLPALWQDSEAPWGTWNKGKPITDRQVSQKLKGFGIKSRDVRIGPDVKRGYQMKDFRDAFGRYLPPIPPSAGATTLQPSNHAGSSDFSSATSGGCVAGQKPRQPSNHARCSTVADKIPLSGEWDREDTPRYNGTDNPTESGETITRLPGGGAADAEDDDREFLH